MTEPTRNRSPLAPALVAIVLVAFLAGMLVHQHERIKRVVDAQKNTKTTAAARTPAHNTRAPSGTAPRQRLPEGINRDELDTLRARLAQRLSSDKARQNEVTLSFKTQEAYHRFLDRAKAAGLEILASSDALLSARARYGTLDSVMSDIISNTGDYSSVDANYIAEIPALPPLDERALQGQVPVRNNLLATLGVDVAATDISQWGKGVTVAVLDSGVAGDPTFGTDTASRIHTLDVGYGVAAGQGADDFHGTSVASIIAGALADAQGIAPAADVLSIRVTDSTGASDMFTMASAIVAAVDNGARIINISLGGYGTSYALERAIDYATQNGAVIVAAAGNNQSTQLVWPAADPSVISVGATDAAQQQMLFSNAGWQLQISAPGYAIQAASAGGQRDNFTGTSASAPVISGAIAAVMSQNPGMTAQAAWAIIQTHADDAGAAGRDSDYGAGVVDLGWALDTDSARVDTAVSGYNYDAATNTVQVVVQNRSAFGFGGAILDVYAGGTQTTYALPWLDPGASTSVSIPAVVDGAGRMILRSTVTNPTGMAADKTPLNNTRVSVLTLPTAGGK